MIQHVTYITVIYITYSIIFTKVLMYSVKPVMLCVVALFNIIKGVLLMTMGNWYLIHLRKNSVLTMEFRKLVHPLVL